MALLFFEGFEAYASASQHNEQSNSSMTSAVIVTTTNPRTGARAMNLSTAGGSTTQHRYRRLITVSGDVTILGAGIRINTVATSNHRYLANSCLAAGRFGMVLGMDTVGRLFVARDGTTLWTATDSEPTGIYRYYELKTTHRGDATGSWTLRVNGAVVQSQSGVQTLVSGSDVVNAFDVMAFASSFATNNFTADDLYVCDGSGSANNDFLGPVRCIPIRPTANDSVAMTPNTGANWDAVNDATPDDDTTFVSAGSTGLPITDRYAAEDLPGNVALVRAVKTVWRARKDDANLTEVASLVRSGSSEAVGAARAIDTAYTFYQDLFPTDPATGAAWTPAGVNAMTLGVRRVS